MVEESYVFNQSIKKAQSISSEQAKKEYSKALKSYQLDSFSIALDPLGESLCSYKFSKILEDRARVSFFIGGAYGFEDSFIKSCNHCISLSSMTFSHKLAKIVLYEQLYRGYAILKNHPYHKD